MKVRATAGLANPAFIPGCSEPPGQYKLGLHDALERFAKADFNDFKFERHCGVLIYIASELQPERVTWHVTSSGRPHGR
jgi:hypothetical protein